MRCRIQVTCLIGHVRGRKRTGRECRWGRLNSALMAKDKSEKKKKNVSDAVPAEAGEDVEMKVSSNCACLKE